VRANLLKVVPGGITLGVVVVLFLINSLSTWFPSFQLLKRQEQITYDWRARIAARRAPAPPSYLGAVYVDEPTLKKFNEPEFGGYQYPLPRMLYGILLEELAAQGAKMVAFDVFFLDRNLERDRIGWETREKVALPSDAYFAHQLHRTGKGLLGAAPAEWAGERTSLELPHAMFRTNAAGVGFTQLEIDEDGVRRRCRPYVDDPVAGKRFWHLGIELAARELDLDLERASVVAGRLILPGRTGKNRVIPLDSDGTFYVNWFAPVEVLPPEQQSSLFLVWEDNAIRRQGDGDSRQFSGKLVVVGSAATGKNAGDWGATPVARETVLCSSIWNIAGAIIENRPIRRSSKVVDWLLVAVLASAVALINTRVRAAWELVALLGLAAAYVWAAATLFVRFGYWVPIVLPVGGALMMTYACLLFYRLFVEMVEKRRVQFMHTTFGQRYPKEIVDLLARAESSRGVVRLLGLPPSVVRMLLSKDPSGAHAGGRCQVSIFFADIRDFTGFLDSSYARAEAGARVQQLTPAQTADHLELATRDVLGTVNLYLSTIAEVVRAHGGTLDKYVGDAVMAFWGAPVPDERHAVACVKAAIAAQQAIAALNDQRRRTNQERAGGRPSQEAEVPSLPILTIGIAINSGEAIAGFMGSAALMSNYTVFGKEVNIAARLEGVAGSGRVIISDSTYRDLLRFEPALAASCIAREPVVLRGISKPVRTFELPVAAPAATDLPAGARP